LNRCECFVLVFLCFLLDVLMILDLFGEHIVGWSGLVW
jgi:hypothetical protein